MTFRSWSIMSSDAEYDVPVSAGEKTQRDCFLGAKLEHVEEEDVAEQI